MSRNILIISANTLKERTGVHDNIDEKLIYPDIKAAQDMFMLPLLGTALFNKILDDINAGTLAGNYKTLVDDYLVDCLCNYVLSELPQGLNYQFWNKGVATKTTDQSQQPSMSDLFDVAAKYKSRAEFYRKRAVQYLRRYASQYFPEYASPGNGVDVVIPERVAYTCPIYLGEDKLVIPPNVPQVFNSNDPSDY
jgi:hypothetical protein